MDIVQTVTTALQHVLGNHLDEMARQGGVVVRQRKFTGQALLRMLLVTLWHNPEASTADFLVTASQLGLEVSPTAIDKRLHAGQPLVDFLRQALEHALQQTVASQATDAQLLQPFGAVLLGDSTVIPLPDELADASPGCGGKPGTSRAALKIQLLGNLKTGRLERLLLEAGRHSDAHSPIAVDQAEPGTLLVYDLGYFDVDRFAALERTTRLADCLSWCVWGRAQRGHHRAVVGLAALDPPYMLDPTYLQPTSARGRGKAGKQANPERE